MRVRRLVRLLHLRVSVGLAPATRADLDSLPGESVDGVGDAALAADLARFTTVWFLRGSTLVQVLAVKPSDEASRLEDVTAVAAAIARRVPTDPPETDDQTEGVCSGWTSGLSAELASYPQILQTRLNFFSRNNYKGAG